MIRSLAAILLTALWLMQFICMDTWTALQISEVQTHAQEHQSNAEVFVFSSFQAKLLNLTSEDFQFTMNGKLYDIESAVWSGDSYVVKAHEDIEEEELVKELAASQKTKDDVNIEWSIAKVFKAFPISENLLLANFKPSIENSYPRLVSKKYGSPCFHFFLPPEELS